MNKVFIFVLLAIGAVAVNVGVIAGIVYVVVKVLKSMNVI